VEKKAEFIQIPSLFPHLGEFHLDFLDLPYGGSDSVGEDIFLDWTDEPSTLASTLKDLKVVRIRERAEGSYWTVKTTYTVDRTQEKFEFREVKYELSDRDTWFDDSEKEGNIEACRRYHVDRWGLVLRAR